jgi:hypothetical protein
MEEKLRASLLALRAALMTTTTTIDEFLSSGTSEKEQKPKSTTTTTTTDQANLRLGPLPLNLPREFTLEAVLMVARKLEISESFTRRWHANQVALGWKDSYGQPVRQPDRYLRFSWKLANRESSDKPKKTRRVLPIESENTEQIRVAAKQQFAEFRRQMSR